MRADRFQGAWKTLGYSKLFQFHDDQFAVFDLSEISEVQVTSGPVETFFQVFDRFEFQQDGFSMFARGGITRYSLERVNDMQAFSGARRLGSSADLRLNFEVFWRYFKENYAFFELRDLDWEDVYRKYRPVVSGGTTAEGLEAVLAEIIRSLNDSHVTLTVGDRQMNTRKPHALVRQWQNEFGSDAFLELYPRGLQRVAEAIESDMLGGKSRSALNHHLIWGKLENEIGYLAPLAMMDFYAPMDLLHFSGFEVINQAFFQAMDAALENALADLAGVKAMIVDVRFNPGGHDGVSFLLAGRFTDRKRLAFTKQAAYAGGLTGAQDILVEPRGSQSFLGPLVLLTSPATASAAEIFVHCMMALPQVTRMGERTRGVLSDMLLLQLPIGWTVSLSNEVYRAADGNVYEGTGIPVQVAIPAFAEDDFYASLGIAVERARKYLCQKN